MTPKTTVRQIIVRAALIAAGVLAPHLTPAQ
jgi:hypothetical protein